MKRYRVAHPDESGPTMRESRLGAWVCYADVAPLLDEVVKLCDVADELESEPPFDGNIKGLMLHVRAVRRDLAAALGWED